MDTYRSSDSQSFTEEEIVATLTADGSTALEHVFIFEEQLQFWEPTSQCLMIVMDDDEMRLSACVKYLTEKGRKYANLADVAAVAEAEQWPGYEVLVGLANGSPNVSQAISESVHWTKKDGVQQKDDQR